MKDLTAFLDPNLELNLGGHRYSVAPPTLTAGLQLVAINAAGVAGYLAVQGQCPSCGRTGDLAVTPETQAVLDAIGSTPLGVISLGQDVYEQMVADGLPEKHIDKASLYALYYWVLGEATADKIMESIAEQAGGGAAAPKASRTGRSTASGSRTKTASTPTT